MAFLAIGILSTLALVFVAYPLVSARRHVYYLNDLLGTSEEKKLNYLYGQKNLVFDNIKDLEMEHQMGKLSETDYTRLRAGLMNEAERVVKEIDKAEVKREIEDLIEGEVRSRRRVK